MKRLSATLTAILLASAFMFGSVHVIHTQAKGRLPLDKLPGVKLKTAETSMYLPNKVIIRLKDEYMPAAKGEYRPSASFSRALTKYSVQSLGRLFTKEFDTMGKRTMNMSKFLLLQFASPMDA
ncbi:MAG TPA: hypothetical protein VKS81_02745, partial [Bacteroidota bacterium]|nr:hypothetical protein [Bacteroidota bacterium]